jgi:chromosomal replication initiator protein
VEHVVDERCSRPLAKRHCAVVEVAELWKRCSERLRAEMPESTWQAWFLGLEQVQADDCTLVLCAPGTIVRDRLEVRFRDLLERVATETAGRNMRVSILVREPPETAAHGFDQDDSAPEPPSGPRIGSRPLQHDVGERDTDKDVAKRSSAVRVTTERRPGESGRFEPAPLNPRYTFDNFVIGPSNRFAHAAAQRVAETPAGSYNPLFIYGDSGLGKTHLLHAIGHYTAENFSNLRVCYVPTETFLNDFVDSIRTNTQLSFKRRYREADVLLVDDVQFMGGNKESTQDEFFHTFNSLYESSKQIVLSSDRHPRFITNLAGRLVSRFEWGLTIDVQPPELETRLAILRKKAESAHIYIPDEVLDLIASHVKENIRELEGALIRVSAYCSLNNKPPTLETAEHVLSDIISSGGPRQITPKQILEATAAAFGFSIDDLCGPSRRRPLTQARQIGMYLFRELTDFSYPAIAREFGGRDHTTVIHAVEKVARLMTEKRQVYDQVTDLLHNIKGGT